MQDLTPLEPGCFYHIYNRGIDGTPIFTKPVHYRSFLERYAYYMNPILDTYAYCLLGNHFHLMVRVKELREIDMDSLRTERNWTTPPEASRLFSHLFNSYAQHFNHSVGRTGSLFESRFERDRIAEDTYCSYLIFYIHANPKKHGFVQNFTTYPYSSYQSHLSVRPTHLQRKAVLDWFGGTQRYEEFHLGMDAEKNWGFSDFD
jgi:putative transposase